MPKDKLFEIQQRQMTALMNRVMTRPGYKVELAKLNFTEALLEWKNAHRISISDIHEHLSASVSYVDLDAFFDGSRFTFERLVLIADAMGLELIPHFRQKTKLNLKVTHEGNDHPAPRKVRRAAKAGAKGARSRG